MPLPAGLPGDPRPRTVVTGQPELVDARRGDVEVGEDLGLQWFSIPKSAAAVRSTV
jgi:hypothetical protein